MIIFLRYLALKALYDKYINVPDCGYDLTKLGDDIKEVESEIMEIYKK